MLVESHNPAALAMFEKDGWRVSYYLPWKQLMDAVNSGDQQYLLDVARAIEQNGVSGISYDLAADQAVTGGLLPLLSLTSRDVKLYAWETDWNLADEDLLSKLSGYPHLDRLLVGFSSPFGI